jgi:hypothetical protein
MNLKLGGIMSKAAIAIGAFIIGLFCSASFSAPQSEHQGASRPTLNWPDWHGVVFTDGRANNIVGGKPVNLEATWAVPFFNTLDHMPVFKRFAISNSTQSLDGMNCEDCQFESASLRYGGGVVNLKGSTFSGTTELQLEGAAANTVALLEFLKAIPGGRLTYKLPIRNRPITRKFPATRGRKKLATPSPATPPQKMDFTAPYIGQK